MPYLSSRDSLLTTAGLDNVLEGKFNRVLQEDSKVTVAMTSTLDSLIGTIVVGRELLMDGQEVPPTTNPPRNPEDILSQTVGRAGEEIIVRVRNDNALTNVVSTSVYIEPI